MISVAVEIVEAKHLLHEEASDLHHLLHDHEAPSPVKQLGMGFCQPGCKELCFAVSCYCVCAPSVPKI